VADYLLDTTVIIDFLRGHNGKIELLMELSLRGDTLGCCCINVSEVYAGMKEKEKKQTEDLINSLEYFAVSRDTAKLAGTYQSYYSRKGITLSTSDVIIAAVAIENNLILVTDNKKHFPMPELNVLEVA
jgi:tRNA(fMet)-specific endonuclease VapC